MNKKSVDNKSKMVIKRYKNKDLEQVLCKIVKTYIKSEYKFKV